MSGSPSSPTRDFHGYGPNPPDPKWPGGARIAVNFNLNIEAGGEHGLLEGDAASEDMLTDAGYPSYPGVRALMTESAFEYGPRVGVWRLLRILRRFNVKISAFTVVRALEQCPELLRALVEDGHEIVSHGYRWLDYHLMDEAAEREHVRLSVETLKRLTGAAPAGFFYGRPSQNTRRLHVEHGGFLYDRDALNDELPYWVKVGEKPHLVIPVSFETNDNRFDLARGFSTAYQFATYLIDCFELMYEEGAEHPRLMTINLHDRLTGRPGRAVGLIKVLEHMRARQGVWFCTGGEIAEHWRRTHPHKDD
jgi:peptidoglycan/xylan/chitin deacetylase (PgdA/CDA1 family)